MGQGDAWQLQDTSTNGTHVNGRRVTGAQQLRHGDVIRIADIDLAVSIEARASAWAQPGRAAADEWGRAVPQGFAPEPATAHPNPSARLMEASGLSGADSERLDTAGATLKAAVTGLTELARSRAKARRDLKLADPAAQSNPILAGDDAALGKIMAMPPAAAAQMVNAACRELQAHQQAGLAAMQAAFRAALDQFAPEAIKLRARDDVAAWRSYEKAFAAQDGFVELFAQEFAKAYDRFSRG